MIIQKIHNYVNCNIINCELCSYKDIFETNFCCVGVKENDMIECKMIVSLYHKNKYRVSE